MRVKYHGNWNFCFMVFLGSINLILWILPLMIVVLLAIILYLPSLGYSFKFADKVCDIFGKSMDYISYKCGTY